MNHTTADRIEQIELHLNFIMQALNLGPYNEAAHWNAREIEYHLEELKRSLEEERKCSSGQHISN